MPSPSGDKFAKLWLWFAEERLTSQLKNSYLHERKGPLIWVGFMAAMAAMAAIASKHLYWLLLIYIAWYNEFHGLQHSCGMSTYVHPSIKSQPLPSLPYGSSLLSGDEQASERIALSEQRWTSCPFIYGPLQYIAHKICPTCIEVVAIISLVERDAHLRQCVCRCAIRSMLSTEQGARCNASFCCVYTLQCGIQYALSPVSKNLVVEHNADIVGYFVYQQMSYPKNSKPLSSCRSVNQINFPLIPASVSSPSMRCIALYTACYCCATVGSGPMMRRRHGCQAVPAKRI